MTAVFIIGGMGAGKSTAREALTDLGLAAVDFDLIGHEALTLPEVQADLTQAFGNDIVDADGIVDRSLVAQRAFASSEATATLNAITLPRIGQLFAQRIAQLEAAGHCSIVVESSNFPGRTSGLVRAGDVVVAITAPEELRIARAVAAGWNEEDVRRRIAQQATDAERAAMADAVFDNSGSAGELRRAIQKWWRSREPKQS